MVTKVQFPNKWGYPMQITGMSIKNVKALFLILNHYNCINSNGIKQQLLRRKSI